MATKKSKEKSGNRKFTNVGALWRTKNGSSKVIASGTLQMDGEDGDPVDILLMKNDKGDNAKRPDFRIVIVEDADDDDDDDTSSKKSKGKKSSKSKAADDDDDDDDDNDDLPF